jgi:hypothetical protein
LPTFEARQTAKLPLEKAELAKIKSTHLRVQDERDVSFRINILANALLLNLLDSSANVSWRVLRCLLYLFSFYLLTQRPNDQITGFGCFAIGSLGQ